MLGAMLLLVSLCMGGYLAGTATASEPRNVDVVVLFDTTSSMKKVLKEAAAEGEEVVSRLSAQMPDIQFGLAEVGDVGGSEIDPYGPKDLPWRLDVPVGGGNEAVISAIKKITLSDGGDLPEAYGRALWETVNNPTVGWRHSACHIIVLIADNVPHDNDLDEGIPVGGQAKPAPWNTGTESPEPHGVTGTTITPQTNLDWQAVLQQADAAGFQLEVLNYAGDEGTLPYWENWASRTGGEALLGEHGHLADRLLELLVRGASRACNPVQGRIGKRLLAALHCEGALAPLASVCGARITSKQLLAIGDRRKSTGRGPLIRLLRAVKRSKYLHRALKGFANPNRVIHRLAASRTAIGIIDLLPRLFASVREGDFEHIAAPMAEAHGVKPCANGLLQAVS